MSHILTISVRLHDGRYHGMSDVPPSPARLFQALVAAAARGSRIPPDDTAALAWLENREPPIIGSPRVMVGQAFKSYLPNNDLDAVGGDPGRIGKIRTAEKTLRPLLFDVGIPWLYAWAFEEDEESEYQALAICALAEQLYQFGRGVDMAWSWGEVMADKQFEARLASYPGQVYHPSRAGSGGTLTCPKPGSLVSLKKRYEANSERFKTEGQGKAARQGLWQAPNPRFAQIAYESPPSRRLYELREILSDASFGVWPLSRVSRFVVCLRDGAAEQLRRALPDRTAEIERVLIGRKPDGADEGPTSLRVKIVPLPSIGHPHAARGIRRVLVEVPAGCPLRADDVHWAFSGLVLTHLDTREVLLTPAGDESMFAHYGTGDRVRSRRIWRTVTPAALPESARRRRIDPARVKAEAKSGLERIAEEQRAATAVVQALRHADVRTRADVIRVQREPFEPKGERVEAFAAGTRFDKHRLWHVEITFNAPIAGPLVIGDGRFLGLGVMAPVQREEGIHAFVVEGGLAATAKPSEVTCALRRAVMARVQEVIGYRNTLATFFTGHEDDGSVAQSDQNPHLTFVFDPGAARLLIIAPHIVDRRSPLREEIQRLQELDEAMDDFRELRAASAGLLRLRASTIDADVDPLFAASAIWESVTPYQVTRHMKQVGAAEALSADLRAECRRCGLPEPRVTPRDQHGIPGIGLVGAARLTFEVAVKGPILLGKSRHRGGGLFAGRQ